MIQKRLGKVGAFWLRAKIVPFLLILTMLLGVAATLIRIVPAMAADADTYSWLNATYVDANYDWGFSKCPINDTGCMRFYGYKNGIKYGESDPWGYYLRNCTSYVAEKISQEFNGRNISGWGNAASWASSAQKAGYSLDSSPQVGDIAVWGTEVAHGFGHVAYVYAVSNGIASLDEYNVAGTGQFSSNRTTSSGSAGPAKWYIHIGTPSSSGWPGVGTATFLGSDHLNNGQVMHASQYIVSGNVQYALIMQSDGNLVEYNGASAIWANGKNGNPGAYLGVQSDGNIVEYNSSGQPIWATNTNGRSLAYLVMQSDGNLVAYNTSISPIWANNMGGHPTSTFFGSDRLYNGNRLTSGHFIRSSDLRYALLMQADGNLVLFGPGYHVLWATGTNGNPGAYLGLQSDGNIVEYSSSGKALWASNTGGKSLSYLVMQNDGNLVAYSTSKAAIWATGTNGKI